MQTFIFLGIFEQYKSEGPI